MTTEENRKLKGFMNKSSWKIVNIRRGKGARRNIIYAELRDENDGLVISATLDYIEKRIRELIPTPTE